MATKRQLFLEAREPEQSLLRLYFDTTQHFGPTKYNTYRIAEVCQKAFARQVRRRDAMMDELYSSIVSITQGR